MSAVCLTAEPPCPLFFCARKSAITVVLLCYESCRSPGCIIHSFLLDMMQSWLKWISVLLRNYFCSNTLSKSKGSRKEKATVKVHIKKNIFWATWVIDLQLSPHRRYFSEVSSLTRDAWREKGSLWAFPRKPSVDTAVIPCRGREREVGGWGGQNLIALVSLMVRSGYLEWTDRTFWNNCQPLLEHWACLSCLCAWPE